MHRHALLRHAQRLARPFAIAAFAAIIAGCQGIAAPSISSTQPPAVTPGPSPVVSPAGSPAPAVALPEAIRGDWHASNVAIDGVSPAQLVRLSLDWSDGLHGLIQLDGEGDGRQVLNFTSIAGGATDQIRFRADPGSAGCTAGDEGAYRWRRSADGLFLSFELVGDACAARVAAVMRTWVHSLTAVTDGGLGVLPYDPWLEIKMPKQRFGASGLGTDASWLHPMSDADPLRYLILIEDPMGYDTPCGTSRQPIALAHTTEAFERYLESLANITVKSTAATIDGIEGRRIDLVVDDGLKCASGDMGLFHSKVPTETDADWTMAPGDVMSLWATDTDGHLHLFGYGGAGVTPDDSYAVIGGMEFLDELPTP